MSDLLGEPEIWAAMCRRFPWVADERGDVGEGLVHLEFGALVRGVERAAGANDVPAARDILEFVEHLLSDPDALRPEVRNAIDVSFFESLYLGEAQHRDFIAVLLGPKGDARWKELIDFYDRRPA